MVYITYLMEYNWFAVGSDRDFVRLTGDLMGIKSGSMVI